MPNHVTSIITAPKEVLDYMGEEFDFNILVPMPDEVKDEGWYEWSITNWGTKWNAYEAFRCDTETFSIQTAWSCPFPIFGALSEKFPDAEIEVRFADEDTGSNCGVLNFKGGILYDQNIPEDSSKEAYELAFNVCGGEDMYIWNEETQEYEYDEDY